MKEKIYTIPVNEAFDEDTECPFCSLYKKTENDALNYVLGPSYMEEDIREETNKVGFCKHHIAKMFSAQNRLGVALMTDTHLKQINKDLVEILENEQNTKKAIFKKLPPSPLKDYTEVLSDSCFVCNRINKIMKSYTETFFYLWKRESEFRDKVKSGRGFCINHFSNLVSNARERMNANDFTEFLNILVPIQKENLKRIENELDWFIQKFDYLNHDKPWGTSKDALERAILKINSTYTE